MVALPTESRACWSRFVPLSWSQLFLDQPLSYHILDVDCSSSESRSGHLPPPLSNPKDETPYADEPSSVHLLGPRKRSIDWKRNLESLGKFENIRLSWRKLRKLHGGNI